MASNSVIIVLINPKSGGKMGTKLLKMFKDLLGEEKVYNLYDEQNFGPKTKKESDKAHLCPLVLVDYHTN